MKEIVNRIGFATACGMIHAEIRTEEDAQWSIVSDSIGSRQMLADAYYGVQSLYGNENFHISGQRLRPEYTQSIAQIK